MDGNAQDQEIYEYQAKLDDLIQGNEQLMRENEVMRSYLDHHVQDVESLVEAEGAEKKARVKKGAKKNKSKPVTLTWEQKLEIAKSELEAVKKDATETEKNSVRMIDTLKAVLEQTDVRIAELKKEAYEFKRDIVVGAENFRTGKTMAENVIRYMEDKLRLKDSVIEKLRLKNTALKATVKKVQGQLQQKQESGDVLHYIDFHQLQIENKQLAAKVEERNDELFKLKVTTGRTVQILNQLKQELALASKRLADAVAGIEQRKEMLAKLKSTGGAVTTDISKFKHTAGTLKLEAEDQSDMPTVMDYLQLKAKEFELARVADNWQRKVEIAELAAKKPAGATGTLSRTGGPAA